MKMCLVFVMKRFFLRAQSKQVPLEAAVGRALSQPGL